MANTRSPADTSDGGAFLWGGIGLGILLLAVGLLTHGFGLLSGSAKGRQNRT